MKPLLAALALLLAAPATTHAQEPVLAGDVCNYVARQEVATTSRWTVNLYGGPIAAADVELVAPDPLEWVVDNPTSVTLTCSLHAGSYHTSPVLASASASGDGVALLPPAQREVDDIYLATLCTRVSVTDGDGRSYEFYWDGGQQEFSRDMSVECGAACTLEWPPSGEGACGPGPYDIVDHVTGSVPWGPVDAVACEVLKQQYPPDGDIPDVWDCPPYDT